MSAVPTLHAVGNHEIEADGVDARISADTESFRYPQDYPFQACLVWARGVAREVVLTIRFYDGIFERGM